jgi:hypothetical protein
VCECSASTFVVADAGEVYSLRCEQHVRLERHTLRAGSRSRDSTRTPRCHIAWNGIFNNLASFLR